MANFIVGNLYAALSGVSFGLYPSQVFAVYLCQNASIAEPAPIGPRLTCIASTTPGQVGAVFDVGVDDDTGWPLMTEVGSFAGPLGIHLGAAVNGPDGRAYIVAGLFALSSDSTKYRSLLLRSATVIGEYIFIPLADISPQA